MRHRFRLEDVKGVDQKLIIFTKHRDGRLATTDYNLSKVAQVREVDVVNINDLANCSRRLYSRRRYGSENHKTGEESDEVSAISTTEQWLLSRMHAIKSDATLSSVTSSLQTSAGKMIFGRFESFSQSRGDRDRYRKSSVMDAPGTTRPEKLRHKRFLNRCLFVASRRASALKKLAKIP